MRRNADLARALAEGEEDLERARRLSEQHRVSASAGEAESEELAAAEAERAQRRAQNPAAPAETRSPAEREAPAARVAAEPGDSRFARMGIVDGLPTRAPDLDEVLQRRRAAG